MSPCSAAVPETATRSLYYADAARTDPRFLPYVIGVSDVVSATVWKDPNLSTDAAVRPDGTITLALVGEIVAAGRTVVELQRDIAGRVRSKTSASSQVTRFEYPDP